MLAVAVGFEPTVTGLTVRRLTNLATPQQYDSDFRFRIADCRFQLEKSCLLPCLLPSDLEAMKGLEPLSTGLQDRRLIQLSYIAKNVLCAWFQLSFSWDRS